MKKSVGIHLDNCTDTYVADNLIGADIGIMAENSHGTWIERNKIYSSRELFLMNEINRLFSYYAEQLKVDLGAERYQECKIKSQSIPAKDGTSTRQNIIDIIAICSGVATVWPAIEGPLNELLDMLTRFI